MHFEPARANYGFEHIDLALNYYREMREHPERGIPKDHGTGENEMEPALSSVHESYSMTHWVTKKSIDFLETRDPTRPFFLWTSFTKPHPPFDPCLNYWNLYEDGQMEAPVYGNWSDSLEDMDESWLYAVSYTHLDVYKRQQYNIETAECKAKISPQDIGQSV